MTRLLKLTSGLLLLLGIAVPVSAAPGLPMAQPKAANLARMRAESLNGGLGSYRAAGCMYQTGATPCLVSKSDEGFLFRFLGGSPAGNSNHRPPQHWRPRFSSPVMGTGSWRFPTTVRSAECSDRGSATDLLTDAGALSPIGGSSRRS